MKKLLMLILCATVMAFIGISGQNIIKEDATHEIYISNNIDIRESEDVKIIETGSFKILKIKGNAYSEIKEMLPRIYGESIRYKAESSEVDRVLRKMNVTIYDDYASDGKREIYGYSPFVTKSVKHNGRWVNMHIVYGNNMIEIGTPLIMGSY